MHLLGRALSATGYSPLEYVQSLRIEEAKQMPETTDDPIDEIATEAGYVEPASFRKHFKRSTGISPLQYRQRFRQILVSTRQAIQSVSPPKVRFPPLADI